MNRQDRQTLLLYLCCTLSVFPDFSVKGAPQRVFGNYGKIQSLAISPDFRTLAFSSDYRDGRGDVVLLDLQSGKKTVLTRSDDAELQPVFSANGQWIYYFANISNKGGIYRMPVSGGAASLVTPAGYWCEFPAPSPDDSRLAYYSMRDGTYHIYEMTLATREESQLTYGTGFHFGPVYSDSRTVYLYTNRSGSFQLARVRSGELTLLPSPGGFTFQPFPDSRNGMLFFASNTSGNNDVYVMNLSTQKIIRITESPAHDLSPVVDSKNQILYFISLRDGDHGIYKVEFTK